MNRAEWARIAAEVNMLWPNARWSADTVRATEGLILDLDPGVVMAAVHDLAIEGREFPPPPGLLRKRAVNLAAIAKGEQVPDAEQALREVYDRIARVGVYRTPEWSHPAIANVVEAMGGWEAVCMDDNPEAFRAHFLRLYGTASDRVQRESLVAPVTRQLLAGLDLRADRELTP